MTEAPPHRSAFADRLPRRKLLPLLLVFAVLLAGIFKLARDASIEQGLQDAAGNSGERLKLIAATLSTRIERFRYLPEVIARSRETEELFGSGVQADKRAEANRLLARIAGASGALALFVTDAGGLTIAASNYDQPGSFVGQNYSYRPYFHNALASGFGSYYAVGATTAQPGYFLAVPIRFGGAPVGVAIVKIDLLPVEAQWRDASELVAMSDRQGIVFLSSRSDWRYMATRAVDAITLGRLRDERRYGEAVISDVKFRTASLAGHEVVSFGRGTTRDERLRVTMPFGQEGWKLNYFAALDDIRNQADIVAAASVMAAMLVAAGAIIALQIRRGRAVARRTLGELERRVAERTVALRTANERLELEIIERQQAEKQLDVTRSNLSRAEKLALMGEAFAGMAHEVNQPLAALATYVASTRLLVRRKSYEAIEGNVDMMAEVIGRVSSLTDQLKRLARREEDSFAELDLGAQVEKTLKLLKFRFADLDITLSCRMEGALPVYGNAMQLDQVILNLLNNAIDAVREREGRRISVLGRRAQGRCLVTIDDSGPGVDASMGEHMFEPFYTTKGPGEGLGLGLATAHRIVTDHHGSLSFGRSPLGGASFTLSFSSAADHVPAPTRRNA